MKKIKITHNKLKRCSLLILPIVLLAATVLTPIMPTQKAHAAPTLRPDGGGSITAEQSAADRAKAYCATKTANLGAGTERDLCADGYKTSLLAKANDKDDYCDKQATTTSYKNACKNGFDQGLREFKKDNPQRISKAAATARAVAYCNSQNYQKTPEIPTPKGASKPNPSEWGVCVDSYVSALATEEIDFNKACKIFLAGTLWDECFAGFKQGLREFQKDHEVKNPATPSNGNTTGADPGNDTEVRNSANCDTTWTNPLSWIICPIIEGATGATDLLFQSFVKPLLKDIPVGTDPTDPAYIAWQSFRVLGNIFLVGCLLAIVFAQVRTPK